MHFKVSELEREPVDFDLELAPGAVDLGEEAEQQGGLAASGHAEVLHEHRGPREIVDDIRLKGRFQGRFQVPCARCVEPVEIPVGADFDLIYRPAAADAEATERSITAPETEIGYYQGDSLALEDVLRYFPGNQVLAQYRYDDFVVAHAFTAFSSAEFPCTRASHGWPLLLGKKVGSNFTRRAKRRSIASCCALHAA